MLYIDITFFLCLKVKRAIQQTGFRRAKRGFQPKIRGVPVSEIRLKDPESAILLDYSKSYSYAEPQDPLFQKEWYLVSYLCIVKS